MEMIDSMADAIKAFNGGVVVISHDFRLLQKVAEEIWVSKLVHAFFCVFINVHNKARYLGNMT